MAHLTGIFRLGRDPEYRTTANGTPALSLALAYNFGRRGENGQTPTQWVEATLWGKRAETMGDYIKKGSQIYALLSDVHIRTYQKKDGTDGFNLSATVSDIEFCRGGGSSDTQSQQKRKQTQQQNIPSQDEFDSDIPF